MSRPISCFACGKYLGEIRDARLRKDTAHVCNGCKTTLTLAKAQAEAARAATTGAGVFDSVFKGFSR